MDSLRVVATVDVNKDEAPEGLGVQKLALTKIPAMIFQGVAYSAESRTVVPLSKDGKKMRITAPVLVPSEIFRKSLGGHTVIFTAEEIELMFRDFMERYKGQTDLFKLEHTDKNGLKSPFLLECWLVEDEATDKANTVYKLGLPAGSWVVTIQFTNEAEFNEVVKQGATGISIEGWLGHKLELSIQPDYADVIFIKDGKALLLQRTEADTFEPNKMGFPGGKIEEGETPEAAAIREAAEETRILITNPEDLKPLEVIENEDGTKTYYYSCICKVDPVLSDEHTAFKWLAPEEIGEDVILGQKERFKKLILKAIEMEDVTKIELPDGEYKDKDGNVFKIVGGQVVKPEEMAEEPEPDKKEDPEKKPEGEAVKMADQPDPEKPGGQPGEVKEEAPYLTKEEVDAMFTALKEEISKMLADFKTEAAGTGKSQDGGEEVKLSLETEISNKLNAYRENARG